jgi:hypothetical protein
MKELKGEIIMLSKTISNNQVKIHGLNKPNTPFALLLLCLAAA